MITDFTKQTELIKVENFKEPISIVGAGSLGSWVAFFLLKMGFKDITIFDFDTIEEHNLPNQMFREDDIGKKKVNAIFDIYKEFFNDEEIQARIKISDKRITDSNCSSLNGVVFMCVDTMVARKELYEMAYKYGTNNIPIWIEGRLSIFGAYVYTLTHKSNKVFEEYDKTMYGDEEAEVSVCGVSQTALPSVVNCATIMIMQMISWYRGNEVQNQVNYSMPDIIAMKALWDPQNKPPEA
jgi:adenylyltransferase/sulfurtransferase